MLYLFVVDWIRYFAAELCYCSDEIVTFPLGEPYILVKLILFGRSFWRSSNAMFCLLIGGAAIDSGVNMCEICLCACKLYKLVY